GSYGSGSEEGPLVRRALPDHVRHVDPGVLAIRACDRPREVSAGQVRRRLPRRESLTLWVAYTDHLACVLQIRQLGTWTSHLRCCRRGNSAGARHRLVPAETLRDSARAVRSVASG